MLFNTILQDVLSTSLLPETSNIFPSECYNKIAFFFILKYDINMLKVSRELKRSLSIIWFSILNILSIKKIYSIAELQAETADLKSPSCMSILINNTYEHSCLPSFTARLAYSLAFSISPRCNKH